MFLSVVRAALVGAVICTVAQILLDKTRLTPARILVIYVVLGVALGATGLFRPLADFAGAGARVPILGFGALMAEGVRRSVAAEGLAGVFSGGLGAAAGGISAALVFGFFFALFFRGKPKRMS